MLGFLEAAFNDTRASRPAKHVVAHNWADQPYARGAYTGFFSPGVQSQPELWQTFAALQSAPGGGWAPHVWVAGSDYQRGIRQRLHRGRDSGRQRRGDGGCGGARTQPWRLEA